MTAYDIELWAKIIQADQEHIEEYGYSNFGEEEEEQDEKH